MNPVEYIIKIVEALEAEKLVWEQAEQLLNQPGLIADTDIRIATELTVLLDDESDPACVQLLARCLFTLAIGLWTQQQLNEANVLYKATAIAFERQGQFVDMA